MGKETYLNVYDQDMRLFSQSIYVAVRNPLSPMQ